MVDFDDHLYIMRLKKAYLIRKGSSTKTAEGHEGMHNTLCNFGKGYILGVCTQRQSTVMSGRPQEPPLHDYPNFWGCGRLAGPPRISQELSTAF